MHNPRRTAEPLGRLHPADVEAIARRTAELVLEGSPAARLLTTAELAEQLGVSAEYVRDHAERFGVIRLGDGALPRLRFDPARVAQVLHPVSPSRGHEASEASSPRRARRPRRAPASPEFPLLPVREERTT